jgi:hypothetical protein
MPVGFCAPDARCGAALEFRNGGTELRASPGPAYAPGRLQSETQREGIARYEPLAHDDELRAGANFLPSIASAIEQITA